MMQQFRFVDLFCGGGGSVSGAIDALRTAGVTYEGRCFNHWDVAVKTIQANHPEMIPDFDRACAPVESVLPDEIFASDPTYTNLGNNAKVAYQYRRWEELGYIDYVPYTEWLQDLGRYRDLQKLIRQGITLSLIRQQHQSLDEQAQELANQIYVLRDVRNALLVGEADAKSMPTGDALKYMIEQLNRLEESYMSMFLGKKIQIKKVYQFQYVPENVNHYQTILFKFSPEYGVQQKSSLRGAPVNIDVTNLKENSVERQFAENQANMMRKNKVSPQPNGFAYLTPANGMVKLLQSNNVIAQKIININQMGLVRYLPSTLMENADFKAEYYPETGTLKSVN